LICRSILVRSSRVRITGLVRFRVLFQNSEFTSVDWLFLVYAAFRATVHVIDHEKKAILGRLLAESVASTAPGETLEEKLAGLTFSHPDDCKFPAA
jgi:hypothetical protein